MFQFFDFITSIFETIVGFVVGFFKMLGYVISFLAQCCVYAGTCIAYLPAWVLPFVIAVIAYSIIMFIINR